MPPDHRFVVFATGNFVNNLGEAAYKVALPLYAYDLTGSLTTMSLLAALGPATLLVSPALGAVVDRWGPRVFVVPGLLVQLGAAVTLNLAGTAGRPSTATLFWLAAVVQVGGEAYRAGWMAGVPAMFTRDPARARAVLSSLFVASNVVGPLLVALGVDGLGYVGLLWFNAATFVAPIVVWLAGVHPPASQRRAAGSWTRLAADVGDGWRTVRAERQVLHAKLTALPLHFAGSVGVLSFMIWYLREHWRLGPGEVGVALAVANLGALAGSVLVAARTDLRTRTLLAVCATGMTAALFAMALPSAAAFVPLLVVFLALRSAMTTASQMIVVKYLPVGVVGRANGVFNLLDGIPILAAPLLIPPVQRWFGATAVLIFLGLVAAVSPLLLARSARRGDGEPPRPRDPNSQKGSPMRTIDLRPNPTGHAAPITHVAFREDGKRLASCSYDGTVLVWDTSSPARPTRLAHLRHRRLANASAWNPAAPGLLATASADKTAAVWRVPEDGPASLLNVLARHTDDVNSVAWLPDGERLVCVSEDGRATMWDALTGALLGEVGAHAAHCMMVAASRDGLVATVGEDGMVAVSEPDRAGRAAVRRYPSSVEGCAWSHSGKILAVARDDGAVDLLSPQLDCLQTITVSTSAARSIAWADDDSSFVVGAYDGSLHFFDVSGQRLRQVHDDRLWPRSVSVAGGLVAAGSFWSSPHLLDLATGGDVCTPAEPTYGPNALTAPGDRDEVLVGCDAGIVVGLGTGTGRDTGPGTGTDSGPGGVVAGPANGITVVPPPTRVLASSASPVLALSTGDGAMFAGTYSGHVVRWDGGRGDGRTVSEVLGAPVPSLCFTGGVVVAGTYQGELIALHPRTLEVLERRPAHDGSVKSLAAFGDGFLSAATDRTVAAGTLHRRAVLWEHGNLVNAVAGLDGEVVASASRDHTVKVGRLAPADDGTWQVLELQTLLGPDESVKCVGLLGDADAPFVVAGSYDFGLYVWRVDWRDRAGTLTSGRVLATFTQGLSCIAPLGRARLAVAGWDGRILVVGAVAGQVQVLREFDVGDFASWDPGTHREAVAS